MKTMLCWKCKIEKDQEKDFYRGQGKICKECRKKYPSQTAQSTLERVYRTRLRNRQFIWDYYSAHPCVDCGESDPRVLELDHCKGEAKVAGVSQLVHNTRSLASIQKEIEKCDVVCANCHRIRTCNSQGWYAGITRADI